MIFMHDFWKLEYVICRMILAKSESGSAIFG